MVPTRFSGRMTKKQMQQTATWTEASKTRRVAFTSDTEVSASGVLSSSEVRVLNHSGELTMVPKGMALDAW